MKDPHTQAAEFLEKQLETQAPNLDLDMRRALASLGAKLAERKTEEIKAQQSRPQTAKILQFPLPFGEDTRAVSNPLARCALFAPVKERQHFRDYITVGEVDGVKIEIKGEQLNQDDQDALIQFFTMANHRAIGETIFLRVNPILRGLGRGNHKSQRIQLFAEIDRLVTTSLRFTPKGRPSIVGHFLDIASTPQEQKVLPEFRRHISFRFNPEFARFFDGAFYSLFDCKERVKLKGRGSELAKWLHLWIIGNAEQYAHKVETIREKCGSRTRDLKRFRFQLGQALDLLKEAGIITTWRIDEADRVHIERTPSPSQQKHLAKKAAAKARKPRAKGTRKVADYLD